MSAALGLWRQEVHPRRSKWKRTPEMSVWAVEKGFSLVQYWHMRSQEHRHELGKHYLWYLCTLEPLAQFIKRALESQLQVCLGVPLVPWIQSWLLKVLSCERVEEVKCRFLNWPWRHFRISFFFFPTPTEHKQNIRTTYLFNETQPSLVESRF